MHRHLSVQEVYVRSLLSVAMNPYFKVDITSAEEEEQHVAKFLKILNSLGELALSFLFQKGVVLGDQSYIDYNRQLADNRFRESIVSTLLRSSDKNTDNDSNCLVAILLFNLSKEASQLFLEIKARPDKSGSSSGIIALSHLVALIDRATSFLNLPSINDKAYWRLITLQPAAQPPVTPPPATSPPANQTPSVSQLPVKPAVLAKPQSAPSSGTAPIRSVLKKSVTSPPTLEVPSPIPELSPAKTAKPSTQPSAKPKTKAAPPAPKSTTAEHTKQTPAKKTKPTKQKTEPVDNSNKPEGPIKAMLRRIAEEIHDNSYEAVLDALKDQTLMKDLYHSPNNPISVKITEFNAKERVVYMIKQKRGAPEPVTFRLIRKLVTELQ
jgi:hypothetical protein